MNLLVRTGTNLKLDTACTLQPMPSMNFHTLIGARVSFSDPGAVGRAKYASGGTTVQLETFRPIFHRTKAAR